MSTILPYNLSLTTAPTVEPVNVADAKRNSDVDDDSRDADFARWITEARKQVERDSRRALINQTYTLNLDTFPAGDGICLPYPPLSSVTSLKYFDSDGVQQTWDSSNYTVDTSRTPGVLFRDEHDSVDWPTIQDRRNAIEIIYVAGYGAAAANVPEAAINAILLLVKHRYEHPETWDTEQLYEIPQAYQWIINGLRWGAYP